MIKMEVLGRLGSDAEIAQVNNQTVIRFSVVHTRSYYNKDGNKTQKTIWVNCSRWLTNGQSTKVADFLKKGEMVYAAGEPSARGYIQPTSGAAQASLNLRVEQIELTGGSKSSDQPGPNLSSEASEQATGPVAPMFPASNTSSIPPGDDSPF